MRKVLLIALIATLISTSIFADSFTGFGISGVYEDPYNYFETGFYTDYYFTFPVEGTPLNVGLGTRLDFTFSIPFDTFSFAFMSGLAFNANLTKRFDLYIIMGPQVTIITPGSGKEELMGVGGGLTLGMTYYFNDQKSIGTSLGTVNYFSAILPDYGKPYFAYYGGAFIGFTVRFSTPSYASLPSGYSYIDYISI